MNSKLKERAIPFSDEMSKAIREGRKTMTRRGINPQPEGEPATHLAWAQGLATHAVPSPSRAEIEEKARKLEGIVFPFSIPGKRGLRSPSCPYGRPGSILWVRETYYQRGSWRQIPGVKTKGGRTKWEFVPADDDITFDAPQIFLKGRPSKEGGPVSWHKRLARFMPKKYARTKLEVVSIRVERLCDISAEDAVKEGIQYHFEELFQENRYRDYDKKLQAGYGNPSVDYPTWREPVSSFKSLWEYINGAGTWDANPWVWVVTFNVLK